MINKLTLAAVQSLISDQTKMLVEKIRSLRLEVTSLKTPLATLTEKSAQQSTQTALSQSAYSESLSFADAMKKSVKAVLHEEKSKSEIIIKGLEEKDSGADDDPVHVEAHVCCEDRQEEQRQTQTTESIICQFVPTLKEQFN
ncbi:hypothetical protein CAPTEDRAFT_206282 [Capitella teleta]|uniref:Uncharacterized protein n=1 Tax=Capitella teleta TaxID=283909 RepID=R7TLZ5_CAPTE|nr:hypothetical protein CAPTEDRAFT_206282 [Capitella teleta]|eukprot:ELT94552.1 hypothetical protein CAPTEDRAFT_206282 [Capitella teleta]